MARARVKVRARVRAKVGVRFMASPFYQDKDTDKGKGETRQGEGLEARGPRSSSKPQQYGQRCTTIVQDQTDGPRPGPRHRPTTRHETRS
jgi:hypothetical protein